MDLLVMLGNTVIQIVDGLSAYSIPLIYEMKVGESKMLTWGILNTGDDPINLEVYATGTGFELLVMEEFVLLEPHSVKLLEIFVVVPDDHPDNVEYRPSLFALQRSNVDTSSGGAGMSINVQMQSHPIIKIGDNPIYTKPVTEMKKELPPAPTVENKSVKPVKSQEEILQEKLARIQAANDDNLVSESTTAPLLLDKETEKDEIVDGYMPDPSVVECGAGMESVNGICKLIESDDGGGCLIATAAYGSELAPQVQFLREIRDNAIMSTGIGVSFMTSFNQLYYSFSPTIADYEREYPMFQELVRVFITPMISTLSIMTMVEATLFPNSTSHMSSQNKSSI